MAERSNRELLNQRGGMTQHIIIRPEPGIRSCLAKPERPNHKDLEDLEEILILCCLRGLWFKYDQFYFHGASS